MHTNSWQVTWFWEIYFPNYFYSLTRPLQLTTSKSGHLRPRYGRLKYAGSQYFFLYIIVVGTVYMVLVLCKVVDSDQTLEPWFWNILEHWINTINESIHNECKRSSPYSCDSLIGVQSAPTVAPLPCGATPPSTLGRERSGDKNPQRKDYIITDRTH